MQLMQFGNFAISFFVLFLLFSDSEGGHGATKLGFTGDTPVVFYWGWAFRPLLGSAKTN